jgi:hypothetical protein
MYRYGKTSAGTQRWWCKKCGGSGVRSRVDRRTDQYRRTFIRWLTGTASLTEIAKRTSCSRQQLSTRFEPLWREPPPQPEALTGEIDTLVLDGVYLSGRVNVALIARALENEYSWSFSERECFSAWDAFLSRIPPPALVVMDGQKGLHEAVLKHFPHARIQRCVVHVERFVRSCISRQPKTEAGRELWKLTRSLWEVCTPQDAQQWITSFEVWNEKHEAFLKERSYSSQTGRWWYTHRKLRAARSHIKNALPYLFTFVEILEAPRTTNHVEGGVNARLKELVHRHRGLSPERKRIMTAYFLASKTKKKPTRKFT